MISQIYLIILPIICLALFVLVVSFYFHKTKNLSKLEIDKTQNAKEGINVPVTAGFRSIKFLPEPMMIWRNNSNPKLVLFADHLEAKPVWGIKTVKYEDIEEIKIYEYQHGFSTVFGAEHLKIILKDSLYTYSFNLGNNKENLTVVLKFLGGKGVHLSEEARNLIVSDELVKN